MSNYFLNDSFNFITSYPANHNISNGNDTNAIISNINNVIIGSIQGGGVIGGSTGGSYETKSNVVDDNFTITELPNSTTTVFDDKISLSTVIPLTIIYLVIFISGVLGNVITCIVISRNKSMHTATNYYLFSLAISDLLVLIAGK